MKILRDKKNTTNHLMITIRICYFFIYFHQQQTNKRQTQKIWAKHVEEPMFDYLTR